MKKTLWYKRLIPYLPLIVRIAWYIALVTSLTKYVCINWDTILEFTFFTSFDGNNVLFIMWLILLLLPLFNNFEGFGIKFGLWQQKQAEKVVPEDALKEILASMNKQEYNKTPEETIAERNKKIAQIEKIRRLK